MPERPVVTLSRDNVPQSHSYPIGQQKVAQVIGDAAPRLTIRFECYPVKLQQEGFSYRIATMSCGRPHVPFAANKDAITAGAFEPRCEIVIAAVRRTLAAKVRKLLVEQVLVNFRDWLLAHPHQHERDLVKVTFYFNEKTGMLIGPR
jgi:hypothetical protein